MIAQRRSRPSVEAAEARYRGRLASAAPSSRGPAHEAPAGARRTARLAEWAAAVAGVLVAIARRDLAASVASHACCPRDSAGLESLRG
jgi:hypothetical protein